MVLVRYRTRGDIELSMKLTTGFTHPSQGARLGELTPYAASNGRQMGLSPVIMCFSKTTNDVEAAGESTRGYIPQNGYVFELFPVHSPLLGESWLVCSPPLIYMLKFSG
jgi:hypothetical protein